MKSRPINNNPPPLNVDPQYTLLLLPTTTSYITAWLSHHLKLSSLDARTNHPIPLLRNDIPLFLLVLKHRVQRHLCIPKQFRYLKTRVS